MQKTWTSFFTLFSEVSTCSTQSHDHSIFPVAYGFAWGFLTVFPKAYDEFCSNMGQLIAMRKSQLHYCFYMCHIYSQWSCCPGLVNLVLSVAHTVYLLMARLHYFSNPSVLLSLLIFMSCKNAFQTWLVKTYMLCTLYFIGGLQTSA